MKLELDGVVRESRGEVHIHPTSVTLGRGLNILIGPTLAGKTSLMRLMAGLDAPTRGRVIMAGRDVTGVPVRRRNVAMVYQQFINYPSFTVYDNIAAPLRRAGLGRAEIDRRVRATADLVHIADLLDRLPAELSGGQQQRTAIARALVKDAELLLFDEPLVNLDYKLREELRAEMRDIFRRREAIVVYATTEPLEALMLGGHVLVVDKGTVLQTGPTVDVYHHPRTRRVGEVFSDPPMNMVPGVVTDGTARLADDIVVPLTGHLSSLGPGHHVFGIRANHLSIVRRGGGDVEVPAVTRLAEVNGSETFIHVDHHGVPLVVQEAGVHPLSLGQALNIFLRPGNVFAFAADGALVAAPTRAGA